MKKIITALFCGVVSVNAFAGGNITKGAELAKKYNCAACHGADYSSPIDPSYPKLAGQHANYLEHALVSYKRSDGSFGRNNAIMAGQVANLSRKDMADLAAYLHSLPSQLVIKR
ncbi:c-type cytochrome [Massilia glaciei]|uniref:Cytochrome C n=1 Tax=Massilia glaciei TaxID=1524097 RepID=A0A2U2HHT8_9BURK|nr:cytochrome c [Massilia glaciei]PWF45490.1 cytochrome C [Massilia glaciei]